MNKILFFIGFIAMHLNVNAQNVGIGTSSPKAPFNVADGKTVLFGADTSGSGNKLIWYSAKGSFRVGYADGNLWDYDNIGVYSVVMGYGSIASGEHSTAIGPTTMASGLWATAIGIGSVASGNGTISVGYNNYATGDFAVALGSEATASGLYSMAMGYSPTASGDYSMAMGYGTTASAINSTAMGIFNAEAPNSLFMLGNGTTAENRSNAITVMMDGKVGIGTTTPNTSALVDINSTSKGFLPPRMTFNQRNSISGPVAGLVIWCSNCNLNGELQVYDGYKWANMLGSKASVPSEVTVICSQTWMVKNLEVSRFRNGDEIPQVTDPSGWINMTTPAWCYYNNDPSTALEYGKLYNWYAVHDARGLAPEGWHIPSSSEFNSLAACLGGTSVAGGKMKETGTAHWNTPNNGASNSSNFTSYGGGRRAGGFLSKGDQAFFWCSDESSVDRAWYVTLYNAAAIIDIIALSSYNQKNAGFSVRCIKD